MATGNKSAFGLVITLILATVFVIVSTTMMMGIPGLMVFALADFPLSFILPRFHGDFLLETGVYYGITWSLLMVAVYIASASKKIPEKWIKSPKIYRVIFAVSLTILMSVSLAFIFHTYASLKTYEYYGAEFYNGSHSH